MKIERILAPTDLSPDADEGVRLAAGFADACGAELVLLTVLSAAAIREKQHRPPPSGYIDGIFEEAAAEVMERFESLDTQLDAGHVRALVAEGVPEDAIVKTARAEDCDLIVMATHGRSGLNHFLVGSVTERVVRTADRPVVGFRPAARQAS